MVLLHNTKGSRQIKKSLRCRPVNQKTRPEKVMAYSGESQKKGIESPNDWVITIQKKLQTAAEDNARSWTKVSIYKVPHYLREPSDHKAYTPQVVSLGPYHHDTAWLKPMEPHKWRSLECMLRRRSQEINVYFDSMKQLEDEARACYEGRLEPQLTSNQFAEMMLLDGCFILEILQGAADGFETLGYGRADPIFSMQGMMHSIQRDMIMLENQVPLFVLDRLLGLQLNHPDQKGRTAELAIAFFKQLMPRDEKMRKDKRNKESNALSANASPSQSTATPSTPDRQISDQGSLHFLDVIGSHFCRGMRKDPSDNVAGQKCQEQIHSVTELKDAGIKIKKRETDRLWDIEFENGTLSIPPIVIQDGTKAFLQNLIAFEQCHDECKKDITSYVVFLDSLIDTAEDVRCLHHYGIIEHWLGSVEEVANLFNCLGKEVVLDIDGKFSDLYKKINTYYSRKWNTWQATLKDRYFKTPWTIISFLAAVLLLIMTAVQTFYGVYSYYLPNN